MAGVALVVMIRRPMGVCRRPMGVCFEEMSNGGRSMHKECLRGVLHC